VERWFRELTEKSLHSGSFVSEQDLKQAIDQFRQAWNDNPFVRTATVEGIIKKIDRASQDGALQAQTNLPRGKRPAAPL